jgi:hypothetical protein
VRERTWVAGAPSPSTHVTMTREGPRVSRLDFGVDNHTSSRIVVYIALVRAFKEGAMDGVQAVAEVLHLTSSERL